MKWRSLRRGAVAAAAAVIVFATAAPAVAGGSEIVQGEGVFLWGFGEVDESICPAPPAPYADYLDFTMNMTGDLDGCWYTRVDPDSVKISPSGAYSEAGVEVFISRDGSSTLETTYTFHAKYTPDFAEIHGRCQHPIVGGSGDYAGMTGRLLFKDDVDSGINYYKGHLK